MSAETKVCPICRGSGRHECEECEGAGGDWDVDDDNDDFLACDYCWGDGEHECFECDGTGRLPVTEGDLEAAGQLPLLRAK